MSSVVEQKPDPFEEYKLDPTPDRLASVVDSLKPTIDYALQNAQAYDDPYLRTKARTIAGKAVKNYDPSYGASLSTWVTQQLQQLHRLRRQTQGPVKLPDRIMLDNMAIFRAESEFFDKHGREPDMEELADAVKLSKKRIAEVRRMAKRIPGSGAMGDADLPSSLQKDEDPFMEEALEYIYADADYLDRKILEMKTGYGGVDPLPPKLIAEKLKLTPSQLSRRSAKLALQIHDIHKQLQEAYSS